MKNEEYQLAIPPKKELIIIAVYMNVEGLSRSVGEKEMLKLINKYNQDSLPEDISEYYYIDYMWIPIKKGASRVELLYPTKFNINEIAIEDIDTLIEELKKQKVKISH